METKQRPATVLGRRGSSRGRTEPVGRNAFAPTVLAVAPGVSAAGTERAWLAALGPRRPGAGEYRATATKTVQTPTVRPASVCRP